MDTKPNTPQPPAPTTREPKPYKRITPAEYIEESLTRLRPGLSETERLSNFGLGIAGEAGEIADTLKKHLFHGHTRIGTAHWTDALVEELGDLLWYVAMLCAELNVSFETVMERNVSKLAARYPQGFSEAESQGRAEYAVGHPGVYSGGFLDEQAPITDRMWEELRKSAVTFPTFPSHVGISFDNVKPIFSQEMLRPMLEKALRREEQRAHIHGLGWSADLIDPYPEHYPCPPLRLHYDEAGDGTWEEEK